jgi:hypothetical protein
LARFSDRHFWHEGYDKAEMVTRIKLALPSAYPYQAGFAMLAGNLAKLPP